jgi:hypothetical protein
LAKRFPGLDTEAAALLQSVARNRALKLFAFRAEIDAYDLNPLCRQLGFTLVDEGLAWLSRPIQGGRSQ